MRIVGVAETFDAWKRIGAALSLGKQHALKVTGANAAWGRNYSRAFNTWLKDNRFDGINKSVRSEANALHENIKAIEAWRNALPEKQRRRLIHPLSVTRRWKASIGYNGSRSPQDWKRDAVAAWHKFIACVDALPTERAAPLWQAV